MRRRDFLARAGALAVAPGALAACSEETAAAPGGWAGVRAQFALRERERNFAAWYLASHPKPVRDAIERHRRGLDASPHEYVERHVELEGRARGGAHACSREPPEGAPRGGRGYALVTPRDPALSAGLVMVAPSRRDPGEVVGALGRRGIVASVTPYRERYVRLGPSIVNDEADVDAAARALRAVL